MADNPRASDKEGLFKRLKDWFLEDFERQDKWRMKAREDFDFVSGEQLSEEDKAVLMDMNRPIIIMNRIEPVIDSVSGQEVANRQEVQYIPRQQGAVQVNEILTSAAKWFRDQSDAEDEESDAFRDTVVCGMGWTETRIDYEEDPEGTPLIERRDPLEMVWDSSARKRNLTDMRRVFHIRRNVPIEEARALCPPPAGKSYEDSDYNASWVDQEDERTDPHHVNAKRSYSDGDQEDEDIDGGVTLVRAQWWDREPMWLVADPTNPQNMLKLDKAGFEDISAKMQALGLPLKAARTTTKVYKQAFLGDVLLETSTLESPAKDGRPPEKQKSFSFNCITGKRDRNHNSWYGLVRGMKDPQRWANKWMSQTMHIMNTTAKGGILAERGMFEDDNDAESSWPRQDAITWAKPGALSSGNPKWAQKPQGQFPTSSFQLMEFAISSIRDTSGVNVETLGMAVSDQAAELDRQRKQSAMTILQPLFDSLRRYRKNQGRLMLYLIENYLSDGRLIRIVGQDQEQYVPLIRQPGVSTYDVIVDEAPTSPNQKEATWAMLQQILPVIGKMLPAQTWLALLKYSPLPTSAQKDISDSIQSAGQQPDPEAQARQAELEHEAAKTQAKIQSDQQSNAAKLQTMREESAAKIEIQRFEAQVNAEIKAIEAQTQRQEAEAKLAFMAREAEIRAELKRMETAADIHHAGMRAESDIQMRQAAQQQETSSKQAQETDQDMTLDEAKQIGDSINQMAASLNDGMQAMAQAIIKMGEQINVPKRLVKNASGEIIGAEPATTLQ